MGFVGLEDVSHFSPGDLCCFLRVRGAECCDWIFEGTESLKACRRFGKKDTFESSK